MNKPLITLRNFTFTYSDQTEPVLNEVSVTIQEGEKILVIGPSGSGKTTFARCITNVLPNKEQDDYSGSIYFGEESKPVHPTNFLPNELAISMVESQEILEQKQLSANNQPAVQPFQTYLQQKKQASMQWFLHRYPSLTDSFLELSSRQFDRMVAAGLMINNEPLFLLDEPLANVDPRTGDATMKFIDELHQQTDATIVIIEHRLEDALQYSFDRLILFSEGRIIADGKPAEILKSDVLTDIGIREPLYITAMRYAGINLDHVHHLDDVTQINGPQLKEEMERWLSYLPHFQYPANDQVLLKIEDLTFRYPWNDHNIVDHVNVEIMKGEMVSVVGPNGSGKSTVSKIVSGQEPIQGGKLIWKGLDISNYSHEEMEGLVGYVPQNPFEFISQETIDEEVAFRLQSKDFPDEEKQRRIENAIRVCSLQYIRDLPMAALSYGQLRRVVIASVLALSPDMIIVDEPTAGQDFQRYTEFMSFLQSINRQGVTVVLITHDMHVMLEYTERAVVMAEGRVIADGSPVMILANPDLVEKSSLKQSSLFTFAKQIGMQDPYAFTEKFVHYDRVARLF